MNMENLPVIHAIKPPMTAADEQKNIAAYCANAARNRAQIQSCVGGTPELDATRSRTVAAAVAEYHRCAALAA